MLNVVIEMINARAEMISIRIEIISMTIEMINMTTNNIYAGMFTISCRLMKKNAVVAGINAAAAALAIATVNMELLSSPVQVRQGKIEVPGSLLHAKFFYPMPLEVGGRACRHGGRRPLHEVALEYIWIERDSPLDIILKGKV